MIAGLGERTRTPEPTLTFARCFIAGANIACNPDTRPWLGSGHMLDRHLPRFLVPPRAQEHVPRSVHEHGYEGTSAAASSLLSYFQIRNPPLPGRSVESSPVAPMKRCMPGANSVSSSIGASADSLGRSGVIMPVMRLLVCWACSPTMPSPLRSEIWHARGTGECKGATSCSCADRKHRKK